MVAVMMIVLLRDGFGKSHCGIPGGSCVLAQKKAFME